jgi:type I restriction enzyme, S subunit
VREGWEVKRLGEVILPSGTVDPTKSPDKTFLYVDVSSVSNQTFEIEETSEIIGRNAPSRARRQIKSGDVIFATIRPTLKRIAIIPPHLDGEVCSTGYFVFRPKPNLDHKFLYYYLFTDNFMGAMERLQTGASYPAVNDAQVKEQKITFPSFPEQKRIVAILDEAFEGIAAAVANAEKNLANARELFESYLNSVFRKGGHGWIETTLGNICKFHGGSQPPKTEFSKEWKEGYVRLIQIRDYKTDNHVVYIPKKKAKRFCNASDVMIGRYGPPLFQILRGIEGAYNVALMKAIPNENLITKDFLYYFLKNGDILRYIINSSSRAAGQIGLNKATLEPYPISYPNKKEQTKIVSSLGNLYDDIQRLETIYQQKLDSLAELKQAILQKAFAGELTAQPEQVLQEAVA